jgi:hypothetical protein
VLHHDSFEFDVHTTRRPALPLKAIRGTQDSLRDSCFFLIESYTVEISTAPHSTRQSKESHDVQHSFHGNMLTSAFGASTAASWRRRTGVPRHHPAGSVGARPPAIAEAHALSKGNVQVLPRLGEQLQIS